MKRKGKIKPVKGWHPMFCTGCKKNFARVTHYGGKKRIKKCSECSPVVECPRCWIDPEGKE